MPESPHCIPGAAADRLPHLAAELRALFSAALEKAYPGIGIAPVVAQCANPRFGDYQCNNAMALFAKLRGTVRFAVHTVRSACTVHDSAVVADETKRACSCLASVQRPTTASVHAVASDHSRSCL